NVNPIGPRGVYDEAKRYAEAMTMAYRRQQGVNTCIARIFNTYGPRMRRKDGRASVTFLQQAIEGKPLTVFGDGSQTRSLCYVDAGSLPGGASRRVSKRFGGILAALAGAAVLCVPAATASPGMLLGLLDDANALGDPGTTFPILKTLRVQVVRMTLNWRGVAATQPANGQDPSDPAYNWTRSDRAIQAAAAQGISVLL